MWLVATTLRWALRPDDGWDTALRAVGSLALVVWAVDEVARGVNPFRRMLGAGVLLSAAVSALVRW